MASADLWDVANLHYIIGLLNNPTSGSYLLDGKDVSTLKESEHRIL